MQAGSSGLEPHSYGLIVHMDVCEREHAHGLVLQLYSARWPVVPYSSKSLPASSQGGGVLRHVEWQITCASSQASVFKEVQSPDQILVSPLLETRPAGVTTSAWIVPPTAVSRRGSASAQGDQLQRPRSRSGEYTRPAQAPDQPGAATSKMFRHRCSKYDGSVTRPPIAAILMSAARHGQSSPESLLSTLPIPCVARIGMARSPPMKSTMSSVGAKNMPLRMTKESQQEGAGGTLFPHRWSMFPVVSLLR